MGKGKVFAKTIFCVFYWTRVHNLTGPGQKGQLVDLRNKKKFSGLDTQLCRVVILLGAL